MTTKLSLSENGVPQASADMTTYTVRFAAVSTSSACQDAHSKDVFKDLPVEMLVRT